MGSVSLVGVQSGSVPLVEMLQDSIIARLPSRLQARFVAMGLGLARTLMQVASDGGDPTEYIDWIEPW